jgi:hypothetical protein
MKAIHSIIAAAAFAFVLPAPADAAQGDPEVIIYRVPGVRDNGGASFQGTATCIHCTNFSGVSETIRFATRQSDGTLISNVTDPIDHLETRTVCTHRTSCYASPLLIANSVLLNQGTIAIAATSINIVCTAVTVDAAAASPIGVALRMIRFNPAPGSQE